MIFEVKVRLFGLITGMIVLLAIVLSASLPALRAARDRLPPAGPSDVQGLRSHQAYARAG